MRSPQLRCSTHSLLSFSRTPHPRRRADEPLKEAPRISDLIPACPADEQFALEGLAGRADRIIIASVRYRGRHFRVPSQPVRDLLSSIATEVYRSKFCWPGTPSPRTSHSSPTASRSRAASSGYSTPTRSNLTPTQSTIDKLFRVIYIIEYYYKVSCRACGGVARLSVSAASRPNSEASAVRRHVGGTSLRSVTRPRGGPNDVDLGHPHYHRDPVRYSPCCHDVALEIRALDHPARPPCCTFYLFAGAA